MSKTACIDKALCYIEANLKHRISLEDIADAANYSQWYFHRLFRVLTGYCVNDYLRRRRLCEASHELLYTSKPIRQIAVEYQFESQASFTRSFQAISGYNPGKFRKLLAPLLHFPALSLEKQHLHLKQGVKMKDPKLTHKDSFIVVGPHHRTKANQTLHKLWQEFMQRVPEIQNVIDSTKAYQVCRFADANPNEEEYTYIAGIEVSETTCVPEGMIAHTVPSAEYAVFEHAGKLDKMHQSYEYIFGVWLPENGYQMDDADALEIYDDRFKVDSDDSIFEIWIPIKKA